MRALKWCAGINPPATVPSDFPTPAAISLRAHAEGTSGFGGPRPVAPFANGALPTLSVVPTGVAVVEAFPALDWESPIDAKPWPGQAGQLMVVEMDGRVFKLADHDAATTRSEVLNITDRVWYLNWDQGVSSHKHGGIFSTAFHPQFGTGQGKDHLYIYYAHHPANDSPDALVDNNNPFYNRLARFTWNGSAFLPSSEQILLHLHDVAKGHEGGGMCFGADGFLYLAFGDGGEESANAIDDAQKIHERARSGVWRMDVDLRGGSVSHPIRRQPAGAGSYSQNYYIPSDNPWAQPHVGGTATVLEEFYAIGLREPHRMGFDPASGFWIGDVGAQPPAAASLDTWRSNLVINEDNTFTNTTANPMTVTVERFRFHASRQGDPVTPFLVRVNADNDFTVRAIGGTRTGYSLGDNDLPFAAAPVRLTLAPGEKIAPGFVDAYPDGSGGSGPGVVSYEYDGTDQIYYSYDVTDVASSIAVGAAPVMKGYQHSDFTRDYYFSISFGFGGKEDEDGDGLPDKWKLAWAASLTSLSGAADSDGDGMTDAAEREAGTDPTDPSSVLLALGLTPGPSGTSAIATVQTVPGRFYKIETSTTLQSWTVAGTWKAANWPATSTAFAIPQNLLPGSAIIPGASVTEA